MHYLRLLSLVLLFGIGCASPKGAESSEPVVKAPGASAVGDLTVCPVTGERFKVFPDTPSVQHEGKSYHVCCESCVATFKADPQKHLAKLR